MVFQRLNLESPLISVLTFVGGTDLSLTIASKHATSEVIETDLSTGNTGIIHLVAPDIRRFLNSILEAVNSLLLRQINTIYRFRRFIHGEVFRASHAF